MQVLRGDSGLQLGRTTHRWRVDGPRYELEAVVETTGVVALFKPLRYSQHSVGQVGEQGLVPEQFWVERDGRRREQATMDWQEAHVRSQPPGGEWREDALMVGAQDLLSIWHQLAWSPAHPGIRHLQILSGRKVVSARIHHLSDVELALPLGQVPCQHYLIEGDDQALQIDVWLSLHHALLPVRVRLRDGKGDALDQQAVAIEIPSSTD